MRQADLVVATGSQANVRAAYASGTPAFGVGAGNVASIVDETADLAAAAAKIVQSKTFDNATSCSSENSVVLLDAIARRGAGGAAARGSGAARRGATARALQECMWPDGKLAPAVIGQSAAAIAARARLAAPQAHAARVLLVEESGRRPRASVLGREALARCSRSTARAISPMRSASSSASTPTRAPATRSDCTRRARNARVEARAHAAGLARDRQPGALHRHRRQLRQRAAVLAVDGLRHLGPQQLLRQPQLPPLPEHHARVDDRSPRSCRPMTTCSATISRATAAAEHSMRTVRDLVDACAARAPDAVYLIAPDSGRALTFGELAESCRAVQALARPARGSHRARTCRW